MWGMVDHDRSMALAVARRRPRRGWTPTSIQPTTGSGAGGGGGGGAPGGGGGVGGRAAPGGMAAAGGGGGTPGVGAGPAGGGGGAVWLRTSSARIRPPGPVPVTARRSTPSSDASRRVAGDALGRPSGDGSPAGSGPVGPVGPVGSTDTSPVGAGPGVDGEAPSMAAAEPDSSAGPEPSSITTSTSPTWTMSPTAAPWRVTVPVTGDGISTLDLSVMISTKGWLRSTRSPSATSQVTTSASCRPSPMSGRRNSTVTTRTSLTHKKAATGRCSPQANSPRPGSARPTSRRHGHGLADGGHDPLGVGDVVVLQQTDRVGHVETRHPGDRGLQVVKGTGR